MNRAVRRLHKTVIKNQMKKAASKFEEMTRQEILDRLAKYEHQRIPMRVWINNQYVVQLYRGDRKIGGALWDKLMIRRNDEEEIRDFYTLQEIKNDICGPEMAAIQVFPPHSELVDVANLYWLFIPTGIM